MSKYLLDTNSIIYALNSGFEFPRHDYVVSVISEIELLSYDKLSVEDELMLKDALSCFELIDLTNDVKENTIKIRRTSKIKLPDSIIVATAISNSATLVTSDKQLLNSKLVNTIELKNLK